MYLLFLVVIGAIWHPTAHESHFEIEAQAERAVPLPSPEDELRRGRRTP